MASGFTYTFNKDVWYFISVFTRSAALQNRCFLTSVQSKSKLHAHMGFDGNDFKSSFTACLMFVCLCTLLVVAD